MRIALAGLVVAASALTHNTAARGDEPEAAIQPSPAVSVATASGSGASQAAAASTRQQFAVKCTIREQADGAAGKVISSPSLVVTEDQAGTVQVQTRQPFVTGVRTRQDGASEPIVTLVDSGVTASITVKALDSDRVQVDAHFSTTQVDDVTEVSSASQEQTTQAPRISTYGCRIIRSVKIGEQVTIACGCNSCQKQPLVASVTVDSVSAEEAAITPIRTAEADVAPDATGEPMVTVVYQVSDLLETGCQQKNAGELDHVDFVPIVDMVLSEVLVEWPDAATIRPFPENGSLVISQTREGHEQISRLLRDKRDNIAAVKRLIK